MFCGQSWDKRISFEILIRVPVCDGEDSQTCDECINNNNKVILIGGNNNEGSVLKDYNLLPSCDQAKVYIFIANIRCQVK